MTVELARMRLSREQDVFALRRLGRAVAELSGLEAQDQVRVATALSEVGREVAATGASVVFGLDGGDLVITIDHAASADLSGRDGLALAGRLVDEVTADAARGQIRITKRLPAYLPSLPAEDIRERLATLAPITAIEELREQNKELASTLEDVRRLNSELQETNTGVMALYNQLSSELEETNRGVVALYAELDEKSSLLREAAEARSRFWTTVSHELRTPLNSIIGLVRLMVGPGGEPLTEEQEHQVGLIGGSAETLLALVGELLDMAKAESGRLQPRPSTVDLGRLVHQLHMTMQATGEVALHTDVADEVTEVYTDEEMLTRVLRNLLSNALKFTQRGEVRLSAHLDEPAEQVVITVADTGIGIPEQYLGQVFEEFFQVPYPAQARGRGTGIGLPYAARLTQMLDGRLELASTVGEGTTATVRLPYHGGGPEVERLLIADDDEGFRAMARRMLHGFAGQVDEAADGVEALESMRARRPDVVVLDMLMPRLDGNALLQLMSEDENLREVAVVVVTVAPGKAAEGHPVLSKTELRREELLRAVREAAGAGHA
ncbi:ATP-binding response regulator [Nonomuraea sp. LPB2021202275-12-8]|uniref:ATP-binding response regulator n=1 Tax=Nonomuraea sp. LPB2021202275-12-8 TaxID=3120159 RepID=UPI00300C4586